MNYQDYITCDPGIMLGKAVIKGTRIAVELIQRKLCEGATVADIMKMYPGLSRESILAASQFQV